MMPPQGKHSVDWVELPLHRQVLANHMEPCRSGAVHQVPLKVVIGLAALHSARIAGREVRFRSSRRRRESKCAGMSFLAATISRTAEARTAVAVAAVVFRSAA